MIYIYNVDMIVEGRVIFFDDWVMVGSHAICMQDVTSWCL